MLTLICQLGNEIPVGDLREMQSLSDGQLSLTPEGRIDYRLSLSRFGMGSDTKGLRRHKMLQRVGSHIRTELCQFSDGISGSSGAVETHVAQIQSQIEAAMRQTSKPVPVEEQIVLLVGASAHVFSDPKVVEGGCAAPLVDYFRAHHPELLKKLRHEGDKNLDLVAKELDMGMRLFKAMNDSRDVAHVE